MVLKKKYLNLFSCVMFLFVVSCEDLYFTEQEIIEVEPIFVCEEEAYLDLKGHSLSFFASLWKALLGFSFHLNELSPQYIGFSSKSIFNKSIISFFRIALDNKG